MKFSIFIQPPRPKPRNKTCWPLLSTMDAPFVVKTFASMSNFLSLLFLAVFECNTGEALFNLHLKQSRTQTLPMSIQRQGACDSPTQGIEEHKIQGSDLGKFIAAHLALDNLLEPGFDSLGCHLLLEERIHLHTVGYQGNVGDVSLISCARMGNFSQFRHVTPPRKAPLAGYQWLGSEWKQWQAPR